jgi:hypothetical protein
MKRTRPEMQADERRKIYHVLSDVDNASKEDLESIVTSIFPGEERRCFEEIKSRAFQYLERKNQADADELAGAVSPRRAHRGHPSARARPR